MWVYFLNQELDPLFEFQKFKAMVEKQLGRSINFLRTKNVDEFYSHSFNDFQQEST